MRFTAIALLVALTLWACTPSSIQSEAPSGQSAIHAGFEAADGSRTIVQDGGTKVLWEPGDVIRVFANGKRYRYVSQNTEPSAEAVFKPEGSSSVNLQGTIWGLYPFRSDALQSGESITTTLPKEQSGKAGSFAGDTHITLARSETHNLTFYNVTGGIRFSLVNDGIKYVSFEGNDGEALAGKVEIGFSDGVPVVQTVVKKESCITLVAPDDGTFEPGQWYYMDALPATLSKGFKMVFYRDDESVSLSSDSPVTIRRGSYGSISGVDRNLVFDSDKPDDPDAERLARLGQTPLVAVYFTEYTKEADFPTLEDVKCFTHINIGHARFKNKETGDGGLDIKSPGPTYIKKLVKYKQQYPELKLLLMIGGWGKNADGFSQMARDADKRKLFCDECVRLCDQYNLDGIDIDWEYPTYSAKSKLDDGTYYYNGSDPSDTENFVTLVKELREALGKDRLISYAAPDNGDYIDNVAMLEWVDYINVMTYSMGDPPYHNSPLYRSSLTRKRSGEECIAIFHKQGVPYDRMNYGIGFYGHGDGDVYPSSVQYYLAVEALEYGTANGKSVEGYNIRHWDDKGKNCYLGDASGKMYASYEDVESISYRVDFVKRMGLLGAFAWEYREDTHEGTLRYALHDLMNE